MEKIPKLSEMDKKDVPGYIWDYYKIPIILGVALLVGVIWFVHGQLTKKEDVLNVATANCYSLELYEPESLFTGFMEQEGFDPKTQEVVLNTSLSYSENDTGNPYGMMTLVTVVNSNTIDVMFVDDTLFEELGHNAAFKPVDEYLTDEEIAALGDDVVWAEYDILDEKGELVGHDKYAAGIRLKSNKWVIDSGLYPGYDPIITLLTTENERYDTATDFVRYVLSY